MENAIAVLDASALLALIYVEPGAARVARALEQGVLVSTVNWGEALSRMAEKGETVGVAAPRARSLVEKTGTLILVPFDDAQAEQTARLRLSTRSLGLSLADRACLALGKMHRLPVLTTDRTWRSLRISVKIEVIR